MASLTVENYVKTIYQLAKPEEARRCHGANCRRARRAARHRDEHAQDARREQPGHLHAVRRRTAHVGRPGAGAPRAAAASA